MPSCNTYHLYLGFSYLGCGLFLHGCSSKVQPLLLTLDESPLLTLNVGLLLLLPPLTSDVGYTLGRALCTIATAGALCHAHGATQDGWVMVERFDRMWSTGKRNGTPLQYSFFEKPMNNMKRQNDRILKEKLPRSVGAPICHWRSVEK